MPNFEDLLDLLHEAPQMLINVEMKCPEHDEIKMRYDYEAASQIVAEAIRRHTVGQRTIISSFDRKMATLM